MKTNKEEKDPKGRLLKALLLGPWKTRTEPMSRDEWLRAIAGDIDPAKYTGEAWFSTDEYAKPSDISDPYVRAQIGAEEDYYPETYRRK